MAVMKIHAVQLDIAWEDRGANFRRVESLLTPLSIEPGSLVVLPEMFSTGFSMNVGVSADPSPSPSERFLSDLARRRGCHLLGGLATLATGGRGRNEAVAFDPTGTLLGRYQKMHPFSPAGEADRFEAGGSPWLMDWNGVRVAPMICYDLRFPEVFRTAIDMGAEMFVVIANWPEARTSHWVALLQARAIENQAWVVGVNRAGADPHFRYPGRSLVVDPLGQVVADAGADETVMTAAVDVQAARDWRARFPALRDRRPNPA